MPITRPPSPSTSWCSWRHAAHVHFVGLALVLEAASRFDAETVTAQADPNVVVEPAYSRI